MSDSLRFTDRTASGEIAVIYGAQCSGKSTFLDTFCDKAQTVSLGEAVRAADDRSDIKIEASSLIRAGKEWPVDLGYKFIQDRITEETKVLDGYPRNINELNYLLSRFVTLKTLTLVYFYAPDEILRQRYSARMREDANIDFFNLRLRQAKQFHQDIGKFTLKNHDFEIRRFQVSNVV